MRSMREQQVEQAKERARQQREQRAQRSPTPPTRYTSQRPSHEAPAWYSQPPPWWQQLQQQQKEYTLPQHPAPPQPNIEAYPPVPPPSHTPPPSQPQQPAGNTARSSPFEDDNEDVIEAYFMWKITRTNRQSTKDRLVRFDTVVRADM